MHKILYGIRNNNPILLYIKRIASASIPQFQRGLYNHGVIYKIHGVIRTDHVVNSKIEAYPTENI